MLVSVAGFHSNLKSVLKLFEVLRLRLRAFSKELDASRKVSLLVLLDESTAFLDLPNRYDLCLLLKRLATESGKLIVFSTHELDIALSVCHTVMLIDNPRVHCLPTPEMVSAGHIERLFHSPSVSFDISEWEPGSYAVRVKGRG